MNNDNKQRRNLLEWIRSKIGNQKAPINFNDDWKDGVSLCALIESLCPQTCPRFDLLNSEQPLANLELGLSLVKRHFKIDPVSQKLFFKNLINSLFHILRRLNQMKFMKEHKKPNLLNFF